MADWVQTIREMPTPQLMCLRGGFGHWWEPISKPHRAGQWGRRQESRCGRCERERTTIYDINDRIADQHYRSPAWHVKVSEPFDSWDVRAEIDRRLRRPASQKRQRKAA